MADVHATAIVADGARLADDAVVGPFCVLGPDVALEAGVVLHAHVVVAGRTTLGEGTTVYPFASLGQPAQIYRGTGPAGRLEIGPRCELREHVTVSCGSPKGGLVTRVGADCMLMVGAHVGHDCRVGDEVIFANGATLGGHVEVGDKVFFGGLSAVHQFVRIGSNAMISGTSAINRDVIPFGFVTPGGKLGARLGGVNVIGMRRLGLSRADVAAVRGAYRELFFGPGLFAERLDALAQRADAAGPVAAIADFIKRSGKRDLTRPGRGDAADDDEG